MVGARERPPGKLGDGVPKASDMVAAGRLHHHGGTVREGLLELAGCSIQTEWRRKLTERFEVKRPECFDFAMDFLGDPEAKAVRAYVDLLERKAAQAQACLEIAQDAHTEAARVAHPDAEGLSAVE